MEVVDIAEMQSQPLITICPSDQFSIEKLQSQGYAALPQLLAGVSKIDLYLVPQLLSKDIQNMIKNGTNSSKVIQALRCRDMYSIRDNDLHMVVYD